VIFSCFIGEILVTDSWLGAQRVVGFSKNDQGRRETNPLPLCSTQVIHRREYLLRRASILQLNVCLERRPDF
jgi:hypothetical protein